MRVDNNLDLLPRTIARIPERRRFLGLILGDFATVDSGGQIRTDDPVLPKQVIYIICGTLLKSIGNK